MVVTSVTRDTGQRDSVTQHSADTRPDYLLSTLQQRAGERAHQPGHCENI